MHCFATIDDMMYVLPLKPEQVFNIGVGKKALRNATNVALPSTWRLFDPVYQGKKTLPARLGASFFFLINWHQKDSFSCKVGNISAEGSVIFEHRDLQGLNWSILSVVSLNNIFNPQVYRRVQTRNGYMNQHAISLRICAEIAAVNDVCNPLSKSYFSVSLQVVENGWPAFMNGFLNVLRLRLSVDENITLRWDVFMFRMIMISKQRTCTLLKFRTLSYNRWVRAVHILWVSDLAFGL